MSYSAELVAARSFEYMGDPTPSLSTAATTTVEFCETVEDLMLITSNTSNGGNLSDGFPPTINLYRHSLAVSAVYCFAYTLVFILGICGNCFVVAVVFRSPRMRTVTNIFIVNLALADILVLIFCLPATLIGNIFVPWILGWFTCKTVSYLQGVSVSASINTLVAISMDRFLAICCPLKCQLSTRIARWIIVVIWVLSLTITLPWALYFQLQPISAEQPDVLLCVEQWPHEDSETLYFLAANMGLCYLLPLCIITACYVCIWIKVWRRNIPGETKGTNADVLMQRSKLKVVKMMLVVVILFVISWLPLYIIFTRLKLGPPVTAESQENEILLIMAPIAQWLGASNSCINPVLYAFFNKKFRKGFLAIIKSRKCCGTLRYDPGIKRNSNMLRSTLRSRYDTQCEYVSTANV